MILVIDCHRHIVEVVAGGKAENQQLHDRRSDDDEAAALVPQQHQKLLDGQCKYLSKKHLSLQPFVKFTPYQHEEEQQ